MAGSDHRDDFGNGGDVEPQPLPRLGIPPGHTPSTVLQSVLDHLPIGVAINTTEKGIIGYANRAFLEIYGGSLKEECTDLETFFASVFPDPAKRAQVRLRILSGLAEGGMEPMQWDDLRITSQDGAEKIVSVRNIPIPELDLMVSTVQDLTLSRYMEQALRESERRYQVMAEASPVGIVRVDTDGLCCHVNKRWREITGLTPIQALGRLWYEAVHPDDREAIAERWNSAVAKGRGFKGECRIKSDGGKTFWVFVQGEPIFDQPGRLEGYIATVTDISRRKRSEEEIRQLAYYDSLTRLPNRSFFLEQLERALAAARRAQRRVAVLFCDLDNFKDINDTLGHDFGDLLLKSIGDRLSASIRRGDTLSRLGGDEFVLLLPWVTTDGEILAVVRKIKDAMTAPFMLNGHEVFTSTSIGIAVFPEDGKDVQTLLKHADTAMYAAKGRGRNRYQFFSEDMNRRTLNRLRLENGLRQAVDRNELTLVWQPQYNLESGALVGVEALLRWESPDLGRVPPGTFIPLAEETGLIHGIGAWVLRESCLQARRWRDQGKQPVRVAVNLSGKQFLEPGLQELVGRILAETGLAPEALELEITESVLMRDAQVAQRTLNSLSRDGIQLAIDDFGTGYSSLLYLKNYPVNRIKIAREFIRDITTEPNDAAIAETVIAMARSLSMNALAEGVETREQADFLRRLGCPEVQGFYFGKPMGADEFGALMP
ncbi:MAG: EAL domain-containing protein [bacterium]